MRNTTWRTFACGECGKETVRAGSYVRFCRPCSEKRAEGRKKAYYKKIRVTDGYIERRNKDSVERNRDLRATHFPVAAQQRSIRRSTSEPFAPPDLQWLCRFEIPFTKASSKNHIYGISGWHVYKREAVRDFQSAIAQKVKSFLKGDRKIVQNKVWISIFVEKPNNRFDAINVIDVIADGIKVGLGIDDRWFCIRQVDWSISKSDPRIIVEFGQDSLENVQACSNCGQLQALTEYGKSAGKPLGIHRICRSCSSLATQLKKEKRAKDKAADAIRMAKRTA